MTKVNKKIYVSDWYYDGNRISLVFRDGSTYHVSREKFNQSMAAILTSDKDVIQRDFSAA